MKIVKSYGTKTHAVIKHVIGYKNQGLHCACGYIGDTHNYKHEPMTTNGLPTCKKCIRILELEGEENGKNY